MKMFCCLALQQCITKRRMQNFTFTLYRYNTRKIYYKSIFTPLLRVRLPISVFFTSETKRNLRIKYIMT